MNNEFKDVNPAGEILNLYESLNFTAEELAERMKGFSELKRVSLVLLALTQGKKELAEKLEKANNLISVDRVKSFGNSIANGVHEEFLSHLSTEEKASMKVYAERYASDNPEEVSEAEKAEMLEVLESSIREDLKNEDLIPNSTYPQGRR